MKAVLGLDDIADVAAWIGLAADRRNVARSLEIAGLAGVHRPVARGDPWRIPVEILVDVLAAIASRRAMRERAPLGLPRLGTEAYRREVAELMLAVPELADDVPDELRAEVIAHRRAARRAEQAAARREATRRRREQAEHRAAEERERDRRLAEQHRQAEVARRHEEQWLLDRCYATAKNLAWHDRGRPSGSDWPARTLHWNEDWPVDRPDWWRAPPGMLEAMAAEPRGCIPFEHVEPDWRRWVPPYAPGQLWPWRVAETEP